MRKSDLRLTDYLGHMLEAIQRIHRYTDHFTEAVFLANEQTQDAVLRNIEIIGEATRNIDCYYPDFIAQHPSVPWKDIYRMRNRVSHGYFSMDLKIIWAVVQYDLPALEQQLLELQKESKGLKSIVPMAPM